MSPLPVILSGTTDDGIPLAWRLVAAGVGCRVARRVASAGVVGSTSPRGCCHLRAAVARRFGQVVADGTLRSHIVPTIVESVGGFAVALVAGIALGYLIAQSPRLERWIAPYLSALQSIPVIAVAPLLIVWTPNGLLRNILVAALVVSFPIF